MYTTLIEPAELAASLSGSASAGGDWTILDCRFDLARPDWGASAYAAGHVPKALYAHLDHDLSGPVTATSGRHPLPSVERLAETFGRWGIDDTVQVVAYDQGNGAYAARLWWLLRWLGHRKVAVLNGGFTAWQQAGLPVDTVAGARPRRAFTGRAEANVVVSTAELERLLAAGALESGAAPGPSTGRSADRAAAGSTESSTQKSMLVDARGADRFAGENETIDPVAGHIPGARNHPFLRNVDARGQFLSAAELRERWRATLGESAEGAIAMCGSGVTACHNLLALEIAGLPGARLYAGSWSEWIRDAAHPVAKGA